MNKKQCCVPGCADTTSIRHRIPLYSDNIYCEWLKRIGNDKLFGKDKVKVNRNHVVCHAHFIEDCKNIGSTHLKIYSLPSVNLPGFLDEANVQNSFAYPADVLAGKIHVQPSDKESITDDTFDKHTQRQPVDDPCKTPEKCEISIPNTSLRTGKTQRGLLQAVSVYKKNDLTPKASILFKKAYKLHRATTAMKKKMKSYKTRVRLAEKFSQNHVSVLNSEMDKLTYTFFKSQVRNKRIKSRGRRFTIDDKIFALSVFKNSGKCYRLLSKYFALPSRRTLTDLLKKIPFQPGINCDMIAHLTNRVSEMENVDKHCCLLFDEMHISAGLQYNDKHDLIVGFEDFGQNDRRPNLADHVLVFMLRGIKKKWKQPVAFIFIENLKTVDLVRCIKDVVRAVHSTGLHVVASVCDQGGANQAAINYLKQETSQYCVRLGVENKYHGFLVDGVEIVHLFDPPHLLKGIRNNLLTKNLIFKWKNGTQTASWDHVLKFYDLDSTAESDFRACPKLTEEHVVAEKIKKMKVSFCAQVFSQRLSATMRLVANMGGQKHGIEQEKNNGLGKEAIGTADLLLFMDKLFDSVNGNSLTPSNGKLLRCAVSAKSPHLTFWREAISVLRSFEFVDSHGKKSVPPSAKNWVSTLQGLIYLWEKMHKLNFKFLPLRQFNQDPVENLFGWVRSHGVRNNNPTCTAFMSSLKTAVVNNMLSSQSVSANCEEDESVGALDCLKTFIQNTGHNSSINSKFQYDSAQTLKYDQLCVNQSGNCNVLSQATITYVNGFMAKSVLKKVGSCEQCRKILFSDCSISNCELIQARAYSPKTLCYPSTTFSKIGNNAAKFVVSKLHSVCYATNVSAKLIAAIKTSVDVNVFTCKDHDLLMCILDVVVKMCIHTWCTNVNRILSGGSCNINIEDTVKRAAQMKYMKSKKIKK